ncbi:MAG: glycosyltransferase family 2 protein [Longimicrobiales bacterium]|nr:glycosyltransferase family 2 protein [Longimicrobiales bacterium]
MAVLIPALNEEEALPRIVDALPDDRIDTLLVVDNGSSDRTPEVARTLGATVLEEKERGYGAACLTGIRHLASLDPTPDVLAFVDADASLEAAHLPDLLRPILEDRADLVLGVRSGTAGRSGNVHTHARLGNRLVLGLTHLLFGADFRDLPPFRAIRFSELLDLEMDDRNWGWTLQMQIRAVERGLRILEIEVPHGVREEGESKISGSLGASIRVGLKMFYTLARERLR